MIKVKFLETTTDWLRRGFRGDGFWFGVGGGLKFITDSSKVESAAGEVLKAKKAGE